MENARRLCRKTEKIIDRFEPGQMDDYQEKWLYSVHGNKVQT